MALKLIEGFDDGQLAGKGWANVNLSTPTFVTGRVGGSAIQTDLYAGVMYTFPVPLTGTVVLGCSVKPLGLTPTTTLLELGIARIKIADGGIITLHRSDTDAQVAATTFAVWKVPNVWQYIELKYDTTTGSTTVRAGGALVMTGTLPTQANVPTVTFQQVANGNIKSQIDDVYVLDTTGSSNNDFLGDVRVQTLLPNADGTNLGMTPTPSGAHYSTVNEATPNTTNYVYASTTGLKDSYQFQDLTGSIATVYGVQPNFYSRKDTGAGTTLRAIARIASTNYSGSASANLTSTWSTTREMMEKNPATSSSWTVSEVNSAEFGVETI